MKTHHSARLKLFGGYGEPPVPPFAYDLFGADMWKKAQKSGVIRLGQAPKDGEADTRAMCLAYNWFGYSPWATKSNWAVLAGGSDIAQGLKESKSPYGGAAGIAFVQVKANNPHAFGISGALGKNEGFSFRATVNSLDGDGQETRGHVWGLRLGDAANNLACVLFQVVDGKPEVCRHAKEWNRADENTLRQLWGIDSPTESDTAQMDVLSRKIYSARESIEFDRDKWRGDSFHISLLAPTQASGEQGNPVVCIVLEGGASQTIELAGGPGGLWGGNIEVNATGGAWSLQPMQLRHWQTGRSDFGPFSNGYFSDSLNSAQFSAQFAGEYGCNVQWLNTDYDSTRFGFRATLSTADARYSPWLFALSARIPNDARGGLSITTPTWDTGELYVPAGHSSSDEKGNPILNVAFSMDEQGRRSAQVDIRDINGRVTGPLNIEDIAGHEGTLTIDGQAAITRGLVMRANWSDLKKLAETSPGGPQRQGFRVGGKKTKIGLTLDDGWAILEERLCKCAPVGDGKNLGRQIRDLLILGGYSLGECAGVPISLGPVIDKASAGTGWCSLPSERDSIASAINGLLDRYGAGLRFYRSNAGVWTLERVPTTVKAAFSSTRAGAGRHVILSPLDWEIDNSNFYNFFEVRGKNHYRYFFDSISAQVIKSIFGTNPKRWLGRKRAYPIVEDDGLTTEASVNFCLRSLEWRHGRPGRIAQFETYFDLSLIIWDRVTVDGVLCEVVSLDKDMFADTMQIQVREVV